MKSAKKALYVAITLFACALLVTACGSGKKKSSSSAAGASSSSTATTFDSGPKAILTGLPESDTFVANRPILTVKIDNAPAARPQFGIDKADVIVEEKVEGGISRFMALFQSQDSNQVGPVRSLRSTDAHWLKPEGGMIAYSGGIPEFEALLGPAGITDVGGDRYGTKYYKRRVDRPFEHSLYTSTNVLRGDLTPKNPTAPKALFGFISASEKFGGATATPVSSVSLRMAEGSTSTFFDWTYNAKSGLFMRGTEGQAHVLENSGQIAMKNVIVQFTPYSGTPYKDRANTPVDEADTTGSGDAWIMSGGLIVQGHWTRPTDNDVTSYTDSAGIPIKLQPGQTWISLVPPGQQNEIRP